MSSERNSTLQRIFDIARGELTAPGFVAGVMAGIDRLRWRTMIGWAALALALAACAWLLAPMLGAAVDLLTQLLPRSLFPPGPTSGWFSRLLAPLNSVAALAAVVLLVLHYAYHKLFR